MKLADAYKLAPLVDSLYKVRAQIRSAQRTDPEQQRPLFSGYGELACSIGHEALPKGCVDAIRPAVVLWLTGEARKVERQLNDLGVWNLHDDISTEDEPIRAPTDGA